MVVWARAPLATLRRICTWEGGLLLAAVVTLATVAASTSVTVVYVVFPVLIWAAWRFKAPEVTLAVLIPLSVGRLAIGTATSDGGGGNRTPNSALQRPRVPVSTTPPSRR